MNLFVKSALALAICAVTIQPALSQKDRQDKGAMIDYKNPYWEEIEKSNKEQDKKPEKKKLQFKMNFQDVDIPKSTKEFKFQWHNEPLSQGATGTCWCFAGTSFFETEINRIHGKKIKISEPFAVYWEYVEKAKRFISERGASHFSEGSQTHEVIEIWKKYGCVPAKEYTGLLNGRKFHDHSKMSSEMLSYLNKCKADNFWNEDVIIANIKSIMNFYMGLPPVNFTYEGKSYTPESFCKEQADIKYDDYVDMFSLVENEYWKTNVYDVPDNWRKWNKYNNVPLDVYVNAFKTAIKNGYTFNYSGDVSEAGLYSFDNVAMIPSFDIPASAIDENARQFRYSNGTTGDDHGVHVVGYTEKNGETWFMIKDSGSGARNGKNPGYYFFHQDFLKLKMLTFMVHKDAVADVLKKMKD